MRNCYFLLKGDRLYFLKEKEKLKDTEKEKEVSETEAAELVYSRGSLDRFPSVQKDDSGRMYVRLGKEKKENEIKEEKEYRKAMTQSVMSKIEWTAHEE